MPEISWTHASITGQDHNQIKLEVMYSGLAAKRILGSTGTFQFPSRHLWQEDNGWEGRIWTCHLTAIAGVSLPITKPLTWPSLMHRPSASTRPFYVYSEGLCSRVHRVENAGVKPATFGKGHHKSFHLFSKLGSVLVFSCHLINFSFDVLFA